jgi:cytochrome P450
VIRRLVASEFTVRAVDRWRPVSERIAAEQAEILLRDGPPADLIPAFAVPVPLRLICCMLGIPERDMEFVKVSAQMSITRAYESSQPALADLREFIDELVVANETSPGDGLIGQLTSVGLRTGAITRQELADLLLILMVAGHTTTASTIALSVLSLLDHLEHYQALREDPGLVVPMVEEFLRIQTVVTDGAPRVAKHDLTLGGVAIRAGDAVIVSLASANRDEKVFDDPDVLEPRRPEVHRHIAFGWGGHRCLGQHLARMELRVALTTLARVIPTLRLAIPFEQLRYAQRYQHLYAVRELLVTWK